MSIKSSIKTVLTLGKGVAGGIPELEEGTNPIELFAEWFEAARESGIFLPESVALATATAEGRPAVRMVLVKEFDERGFVFYTNYASRKAEELDANPSAALCFHWAVLERQVRISGHVARVTEEESLAYFKTRPRGSRIGAWASRQSAPLEDRSTLEERVKEEVPLPPFWGGYRLVPETIEFWQGRADRLHDRVVFTREGPGWQVHRLQP
jgi:pyridoxamine 5'-phosphate oxidase